MRVAWYRFRASFARRWSGYLSIVLLVGTIGGLAMASVAGARRTASSFPTYLASTNPSTLALFSRYDDPAFHIDTGYNATLATRIAHLALVKRSATAVIFDGNIDLNSVKGVRYDASAGEAPPTIIGSPDGEYTQMDRVVLLKGRYANPQRLNEAIMNARAAQELDLHIGSVIQIPFYTDVAVNSPKNFNPVLQPKIKIVGEFINSRDVVESDISRLGSSAIILSQSLTRKLMISSATGTETFVQIRGGDAGAQRFLNEVYGFDALSQHFPAEVTSSFLPVAQQVISPEALALAIFGAIAALAALLIVALTIGRTISAASEELLTLRALGARRSMLLGDQLVGVLAALVVGSVLAVAVAVALSPLTPIGPVRAVYPDRGVAFDWTVLGIGVLVLVLVLGAIATLQANRAVRRISSTRASTSWKPESRWLRSVATSGLPISLVTGVRFALEPGRGRSATPVRTAALGAVLAVGVLVTTVTFGASLDSLVSHPSLYGWNWNYVLLSSFSGAEDLPGPQITKFLDEDSYIQQWSGIYVVKTSLDGQKVQAIAERPGALVQPPVLTGHGLESSSQIVLGNTTMASLHKKVGDTVLFNNGISTPKKLLIVGTVTLPSIGTNESLGQGAVVAASDFPTALRNLQDATIPGPNAIAVRIKAGANRGAAYRSLQKIDRQVNAVKQADGLAGGIVALLRPAEIVDFRALGTTPAVLAVGLALGAVAALGLTLVASVRRRRRELALLKALGFSQRQLAASIAWQATVASLIGCVVGIPIGIVAGQQLWTLFARSINVVPHFVVPALNLVVVGVGALLFANLMAALPGRSAARTPTALVLRAE